MSIIAISQEQAHALLSDNADVQIADIRDSDWFNQSHISGAVRLGSDTLEDFLCSADLDTPLLVYCHHGISSMGAGEILLQRGFNEVMSLNGGFEEWRCNYPQSCT